MLEPDLPSHPLQGQLMVRPSAGMHEYHCQGVDPLTVHSLELSPHCLPVRLPLDTTVSQHPLVDLDCAGVQRSRSLDVQLED
jgi:hypothetical protein